MRALEARRIMQNGGRVVGHGHVGRLVEIQPNRGRSWCVIQLHFSRAEGKTW